MEAEKKPWGYLEEIGRQHYSCEGVVNAVLARQVRARINPGGFSSIHRHNEQSNDFYVLSGQLWLREFRLDGAVPVQIGSQVMLEPNDHPLHFAAGHIHQFEAETAVVLLEIYVATPGGSAVPEDIERFSENGVRPDGYVPPGTVVSVRARFGGCAV